VLHSGHLSRVFTSLMGTSCNLRWREAGDRELIWTPVETLESPVGWYRPQGAQDMAGS
jgi:trehalose utilization protein